MTSLLNNRNYLLQKSVPTLGTAQLRKRWSQMGRHCPYFLLHVAVCTVLAFHHGRCLKPSLAEMGSAFRCRICEPPLTGALPSAQQRSVAVSSLKNVEGPLRVCRTLRGWGGRSQCTVWEPRLQTPPICAKTPEGSLTASRKFMDEQLSYVSVCWLSGYVVILNSRHPPELGEEWVRWRMHSS